MAACGGRTSDWSGNRFAEQNSLAIPLNRGPVRVPEQTQDQQDRGLTMDTERLREAYKDDYAVKAVCDEMAARERNQAETKLRRMMARLSKDGIDVRKRDVIAAFRTLEECGCGQYVVGRHGWPSRFVWAVGSIAACQAAQGMTTDIQSLPEANDDEEAEAEFDSVTHVLRLREDFDVELQLTADLTEKEASRIAAFVSALPIDE